MCAFRLPPFYAAGRCRKERLALPHEPSCCRPCSDLGCPLRRVNTCCEAVSRNDRSCRSRQFALLRRRLCRRFRRRRSRLSRRLISGSARERVQQALNVSLHSNGAARSLRDRGWLSAPPPRLFSATSLVALLRNVSPASRALASLRSRQSCSSAHCRACRSRRDVSAGTRPVALPRLPLRASLIHTGTGMSG